eukprot:4755026-Prymnesium_polylepis.1
MHQRRAAACAGPHVVRRCEGRPLGWAAAAVDESFARCAEESPRENAPPRATPLAEKPSLARARRRATTRARHAVHGCV